MTPGFDLTSAGIRRPPPRRWFSANVYLLPTEEHPGLVRGFQMLFWTDRPLPEAIDGAEQAYTCLINWMMEIPEPPEVAHEDPAS